MRADGSDLARVHPRALDYSWSPDGTMIAFAAPSRLPEGGTDIFLLTAKGRTRLTRGKLASQPCWSPDGTKILFAMRSWGEQDVCVIDPNGRNRATIAALP